MVAIKDWLASNKSGVQEGAHFPGWGLVGGGGGVWGGKKKREELPSWGSWGGGVLGRQLVFQPKGEVHQTRALKSSASCKKKGKSLGGVSSEAGGDRKLKSGGLVWPKRKKPDRIRIELRQLQGPVRMAWDVRREYDVKPNF